MIYISLDIIQSDNGRLNTWSSVDSRKFHPFISTSLHFTSQLHCKDCVNKLKWELFENIEV